MATLSPIAKLPRPELTDSPNAPAAFTNLTNALDPLVIPRFNTTFLRDAAIPSPTSGQHAWIVSTNTLTVYNSSTASWNVYGAGNSVTKAVSGLNSAALNTPMNLTTTPVDCPGTNIVFSAIKPNSVAMVTMVADFQTYANSAGTGSLVANLDGTDLPTQAIYCGSNVNSGARATVAQVNLAFPTVGTHTLKLRTFLTGVTGVRLMPVHTSITLVHFE